MKPCFFLVIKNRSFQQLIKKTVEVGSLPPIIYKALYIPGGERFLPSTVWVVSAAQTCGSEVSPEMIFTVLEVSTA